MSQQTIGVGTAANDGTGDTVRSAAVKTNSNFTELYASAAKPLVHDTAAKGFWSNVDASPPNIHKIRDRVFVGAATDMVDTTSTTNSTWLSSLTVGASWALRDSQFVVQSDRGQMAVTGISRSSDATGGVGTTIGVSGLIINDTNSRTAWAFYSDVQLESTTGTTAWGIEFAVKNKASNVTSSPYTTGGPYGACGIWMVGGGDNSYGGTAANPNNFAIGISGATSTWNKGIVFFDSGLTRDGNSVATAIHMAKGHRLIWDVSASLTGKAAIWLDPNATGTIETAVVFGDGLVQLQAGGNAIVNFQGSSTAVNRFAIVGAATGSGPQIQTAGADTDIDLVFTPKGAGVLRFGARTALGAETLSGYITIKDSSGTVRKLAVIA